MDGHTFAPMTYTALCEYVADESRRLGGPPLRPQKRLNSNGSIDYVVFYCPHGRKHGDQAGRKPIKNPNRALRTKGDRKTLFCDCKFRFRVRLDRAVPPILVAKEEDAQEAALPGAARCSNSKKDQADHERYVYGWYVDSPLATKPNLTIKHHACTGTSTRPSANRRSRDIRSTIIAGSTAGMQGAAITSPIPMKTQVTSWQWVRWLLRFITICTTQLRACYRQAAPCGKITACFKRTF
jgi:hypothetical protein